VEMATAPDKVFLVPVQPPTGQTDFALRAPLPVVLQNTGPLTPAPAGSTTTPTLPYLVHVFSVGKGNFRAGIGGPRTTVPSTSFLRALENGTAELAYYEAPASCPYVDDGRQGPCFHLIDHATGTHGLHLSRTSDPDQSTIDATLNVHATSIAKIELPAGSIVSFAGAAAPPGFLLCDGATRNVADYPRLGNVLKATFGGDGVATFAVPDLRGRFVLGAGHGHNIAVTGGAETVTLTVAQLPAHTHTGTTGTGNSKFYRLVDPGNADAAFHSHANHTPAWRGGGFRDLTDTAWPSADHTHDFTTQPTGNGQAISIMAPHLVLGAIIKC